MKPILCADSIGKSFGDRAVLKSAYLGAHSGAVVVLVGANGAGKSTLMRIAAGALTPDFGFVELDGERFVAPRAATLADRGVLFLPIDRSILAPRWSLDRHLDCVEWRFGAGDRSGVLDRLGLSDLRGVETGALSGGERRRAELALALLRRPRVLLLDEPFFGIDPLTSEILKSTLRQTAISGTAVVVSGHETTWLFDVADRVVWVESGTTRDLGTPTDALVDFNFARSYFGTAAAPASSTTSLPGPRLDH